MTLNGKVQFFLNLVFVPSLMVKPISLYIYAETYFFIWTIAQYMYTILMGSLDIKRLQMFFNMANKVLLYSK